MRIACHTELGFIIEPSHPDGWFLSQYEPMFGAQSAELQCGTPEERQYIYNQHSWALERYCRSNKLQQDTYQHILRRGARLCIRYTANDEIETVYCYRPFVEAGPGALVTNRGI